MKHLFALSLFLIINADCASRTATRVWTGELKAVPAHGDATIPLAGLIISNEADLPDQWQYLARGNNPAMHRPIAFGTVNLRAGLSRLKIFARFNQGRRGPSNENRVSLIPSAGGIQHDTICWFVRGGVGAQFGANFNALKEIDNA